MQPVEKKEVRLALFYFPSCRLCFKSQNCCQHNLERPGCCSKLQMFFLRCLWVVLQPAAAKGIWSSHSTECYHSTLCKVVWSLHGRTFSLAVSGWHVSFYSSSKTCMQLCKCMYACMQVNELRISFPIEIFPLYFINSLCTS